jgi:hypothetical protein
MVEYWSGIRNTLTSAVAVVLAGPRKDNPRTVTAIIRAIDVSPFVLDGL